MKKRAQLLTLFVMLALFLLLSLSLLYYFISQKTSEKNNLNLGSEIALSSQTTLVSSIVQDCLEEKVIQAIDKFCGTDKSSEPCVEEYIQYYFDDCFDQQELANRGIQLEAGKPKVSAILNYDTLLIDMEYPIKIIREGQTSKLSAFKYSLPLKSFTRLDLDSEQKTTEELRILSQDSMAELIIPAGTKISSASGEPITQLSLRIADKHEGGLVNNVVMGTTIYDGQPDGIQFEPAATIRLKYSPDKLFGIREDELKIGWFDPNAGIWRGLPSSEVDVANKIVSARLSHFTRVGPVACTSSNGETDTIRFSYKNVVKKAIKVDPSTTPSNPQENSCRNTAEGAPPNLDATLTTPHDTYSCLVQQGTDGDYYASFSCHNGVWAKEICDQSGCDPSTNKCRAAQQEQDPFDVIKKALSQQLAQSQSETAGCGCSCEKNCQIFDGQELEKQGFGSLGFYSFTIEPDGNGCVMDKGNGDADIRVDLLGSTGDRFGGSDTNPGIIFTSSGTYREVEFLEGTLTAGKNTAYFKMENTNGDDCVWADVKVIIKGKGITYPEQCPTPTSTLPASLTGSPQTQSAADTQITGCTVQDTINTLCGKRDSAYNDLYPNCEHDSENKPIGFTDPARSPALWSLINAAKSIDPSSWRSLPLSQLSNKDQLLNTINQLGLNLVCEGATGSSGYECKASTSSSDSMMGGSQVCSTTQATDANVNDCQSLGGHLVFTMASCSSEGGRPLPYATGGSGSQICCSSQGCCLSSYGIMKDSSRADCTGEQPVSSTGNECGDEIVKIAESALGHPYVLGAPEWDAKSIPSAGAAADCGSFTEWVYNRYAYLTNNPGYKMSISNARNAYFQAKYFGTVVDYDPVDPKNWDKIDTIKIDCSKLQKGDLLFFFNNDVGGGTRGIAHVGIYYGNCKMIHSGTTTNGVGILQDLTTYNAEGNHYAGARRVCPTKLTAPTTPIQTTSKNTFLESSCSNVKGCCTWSGNTNCWKDVSKQRCDQKQGSTFYPSDTQCSKFPSCKVESEPTSFITEYARQYLGCPYAYDPKGFLTPQNCGAGLTCATFVTSVLSYTCNQMITGHGAAKCDNPGVIRLGNDVNSLQPGDIFSYGYVDEGSGKYGHTGLYMGRGYISGNVFTPDPSGQPIFIHSYPGPGVSYSDYNWLKNHGPDVRFCRVKSCSSQVIA